MNHKRFWVMAGIMLGAVLLSLCVGRYPLTLSDLWGILTGSDGGMGSRVFLQIRLPRTFLVLACGAALSISGLVYQNIFRNPLVSPDVLGVTGGASVGAAAAILAGASAAATAASAFGAGIFTVLVTVALAKAAGGQQKVTLLISGIVTGALAGALLMMLKYLADPSQQLPSIEYWLMGSFHTSDWKDVGAAAPVIAASLFCLWLMRWKLQLLVLGEEEAGSLGLPVGKVRLAGALLATLLAASVVSAAGAVSWIGLIVPHMIRRLFGDDLKRNFSLCAMGGGTFLLLADTLARSLTAAEVPVSILTSFAGALLLALALAGRSRKGELL